MHSGTRIDIESPAFDGTTVVVQRFDGREELSQIYELHAEVLVPEGANVDPAAIVGRSAKVVLRHAGEEVRRIFGVISEVEDLMLTEPGFVAYRLTVVPRAYHLSLNERMEVFVDKSVPEIIEAKLEAAGLKEKDADYALRLDHDYPKREFVFQYKESDLAFVSRLCEHLGITLSFDHSGDRDQLVFSDDKKRFEKASGGPIELGGPGEEGDIFELRTVMREIPNRVKLCDYDYHAPTLDLTVDAAISGAAGREVFEYGANYTTPDLGRLLARVRAEELVAGKTVYQGRSAVASLAVGTTVVIEGHPRGPIDLLIVEVGHHYAQPDEQSKRDHTAGYTSSFRAIPADVQYRPARRTPKPRVSGMLTGTIDAATGEYADVDSEGRYRVRFHFDATGAAEGHASAALRMAQPHAGPNYGMHFPLRPGIEVIIAFIDGDPDRPVISGCVPNALTPSPVAKKNLTSNVIRTGANNEIHLEDAKGKERIKLYTPHKNTTLQLGSPNTPESGFAATTEGHMTMASAGMFSQASPLITQLTKFKSAWSGNSVTLAEFSALELGLVLAEILSIVAGGVVKALELRAADKKPDNEKELEDKYEAAKTKEEGAKVEDDVAADALKQATVKRAAVCAEKGLADDDAARKQADDWKDSKNPEHMAWAQRYLDADDDVKAAQARKEAAETKKAAAEQGAAGAKKSKEDALKISADAEAAAGVAEIAATFTEGATKLLSGIVAIATAKKNAEQIVKTTTSWNISKNTSAEAAGDAVPIVQTWLSGMNINAGEKLAAIRGEHAFVAGVETRVHGWESVHVTSHEKVCVAATEVSLLGRETSELLANHKIWIGARPGTVGHLLLDAEKAAEAAAIGHHPLPVPPLAPALTAEVTVSAHNKLTLMSESAELHAWALGATKIESGASIALKVGPWLPPVAVPVVPGVTPPEPLDPPPLAMGPAASLALDLQSSSIRAGANSKITLNAPQVLLQSSVPAVAPAPPVPPTWGLGIKPTKIAMGNLSPAPGPKIEVDYAGGGISLSTQFGPYPESGLDVARNKVVLSSAAAEVSAEVGNLDLNAGGMIKMNGVQILLG